MSARLPIVLVLALLAGCGDDGDGDGSTTVSAQLHPVGGSGVEGVAELRLEGDNLAVRIDATGLAPNRIHGQSINGFPEDERRARCPRPGSEAQVPPALRAIEPYPTLGKKRRLEYRLTIDVDVTRLQPLERRLVVLYGAEGGDGARYRPDVPVACGELRSGGLRRGM